MTRQTEPATETRTKSVDAETGGYVLPADADPHVCPYCDTPFADDDYLALHLGLAHRGELSEEELTAFEEAYDDEREGLRLFRLKALGLLVVLYFGLLMTYAVFA